MRDLDLRLEIEFVSCQADTATESQMRQLPNWPGRARGCDTLTLLVSVIFITCLELLVMCGVSLMAAGCPLLTDLSVFELAANLPKLRRIGLVKVRRIPIVRFMIREACCAGSQLTIAIIGDQLD